MAAERTQVVIVGAGPAGTLLALLLAQAGIEVVVLERQTRERVLGRLRAGVLEPGTVETLRRAGAGDRLDRLGHRHDTINIAWQGRVIAVDTARLVGARAVAYGQAAIQEDLYRAADAAEVEVRFGVEDVRLAGLTTDRPRVRFAWQGDEIELAVDFVAGCDGSHGVCRLAIPAEVRQERERRYPFGWLGILSATPPLPIIVYAAHERGFGLCSMRNPELSRYYVQCPIDDAVEDWPDDRFWDELRARLPGSLADQVVTGPSIEKSITPLRSFVSEPMRHGRLLLAGDAAHVVPPTGAKGLNLAVRDAAALAEALADHYRGDDRRLDAYSAVALERVWRAVRFSWWLTTLLHRFPSSDPFEDQLKEVELGYLAASPRAQALMAEQFVGLPPGEGLLG